MRILIFGATSAIAEAVARIYAGRGASLCLVARRAEQLDVIAADLAVRGAAAVATATADARALDGLDAVVDEAVGRLGGRDLALIAHGTLPDQSACETSLAALREAMEVNALSVMALASRLAGTLAAQGSGTLAVISSVAGDRGRQSNYTYGAAKAAVDAFASGLRNRLARRGVHVLTIKPGFVDTPMTADFPKGPLWARPEAVARGIVRAVDRGRNVAYLPWFWRPIMWVIRTIPEPIFKRLKL